MLDKAIYTRSSRPSTKYVFSKRQVPNSFRLEIRQKNNFLNYVDNQAH